MTKNRWRNQSDEIMCLNYYWTSENGECECPVWFRSESADPLVLSRWQKRSSFMKFDHPTRLLSKVIADIRPSPKYLVRYWSEIVKCDLHVSWVGLLLVRLMSIIVYRYKHMCWFGSTLQVNGQKYFLQTKILMLMFKLWIQLTFILEGNHFFFHTCCFLWNLKPKKRSCQCIWPRCAEYTCRSLSALFFISSEMLGTVITYAKCSAH